MDENCQQERYRALYQIGKWRAEFESCKPDSLPHSIPPYIGLNREGQDEIRASETINELPFPEARLTALRAAFKGLGAANIVRNGTTSFSFGLPCYVSLGLTKNEAQAMDKPWLMLRAAHLPLTLFWKFSTKHL